MRREDPRTVIAQVREVICVTTLEATASKPRVNGAGASNRQRAELRFDVSGRCNFLAGTNAIWRIPCFEHRIVMTLTVERHRTVGIIFKTKAYSRD